MLSLAEQRTKLEKLIDSGLEKTGLRASQTTPDLLLGRANLLDYDPSAILEASAKKGLRIESCSVHYNHSSKGDFKHAIPYHVNGKWVIPVDYLHRRLLEWHKENRMPVAYTYCDDCAEQMRSRHTRDIT